MSDIFKYITNTDINKIKTNYNKLYQGSSILSGRRDFFKELTHGLSLIQSGSLIEGVGKSGAKLQKLEIDINYNPNKVMSFPSPIGGNKYCNYKNNVSLPVKYKDLYNFSPNSFDSESIPQIPEHDPMSRENMNVFKNKLETYKFTDNEKKIFKDLSEQSVIDILDLLSGAVDDSDKYTEVLEKVEDLDGTNIFRRYFISSFDHVHQTFLNEIYRSRDDKSAINKDNINDLLKNKFNDTTSLSGMETNFNGNIYTNFNKLKNYIDVIEKLLTFFDEDNFDQYAVKPDGSTISYGEYIDELFTERSYPKLRKKRVNGRDVHYGPNDESLFTRPDNQSKSLTFDRNSNYFNDSKYKSNGEVSAEKIYNEILNGASKNNNKLTNNNLENIRELIRYIFNTEIRTAINYLDANVATHSVIKTQTINLFDYLKYVHSKHIIKKIEESCYNDSVTSGSDSVTSGSDSVTSGSDSVTSGNSGSDSGNSGSDSVTSGNSGSDSGNSGSSGTEGNMVEIKIGTKTLKVYIGGFSTSDKDTIRENLIDFSNNLVKYNTNVADFEIKYKTFSENIEKLNKAIRKCKTTCTTNTSNNSHEKRQACYVGCDLSGYNLDNSEIKSWDMYENNFIKNCDEYTNDKKTSCLGATVTSDVTQETLKAEYTELTTLNNTIQETAENLITYINKLKEFNINVITNSETLSTNINDNIGNVGNMRNVISRRFSKAKKTLLNARVFDAIKKKEAYDLRNKVWLGLAIALGLATMYKIKSM